MNSKSKSKVKRDRSWISLSEATHDALKSAAEAAEKDVAEPRIERSEREAERKIMGILEDPNLSHEESLERIRRVLESVPDRCDKGGAA